MTNWEHGFLTGFSIGMSIAVIAFGLMMLGS